MRRLEYLAYFRRALKSFSYPDGWQFLFRAFLAFRSYTIGITIRIMKTSSQPAHTGD